MEMSIPTFALRYSTGREYSLMRLETRARIRFRFVCSVLAREEISLLVMKALYTLRARKTNLRLASESPRRGQFAQLSLLPSVWRPFQLDRLMHRLRWRPALRVESYVHAGFLP